MSENPWSRANDEWLLARIRLVLQRLVGAPAPVEASDAAAMVDDAASVADRIRASMDEAPALEQLADALALVEFERELLVLLAGVEIHPPLALAVGRMLGHDHEAPPTPALAFDHLPNGHWSALSPGRPLRGLRMIEISRGASLATSALRIDERVLNHLLGVDYLDDRLGSLLRPLRAPDIVAESHRRLADRVLDAWADGSSLVQVVGPHRDDRLAIVARAADAIGMACFALTADDIPHGPAEREGLERLWAREMVFAPAMLLVEVGHATSDAAAAAAARLAETSPGVVVSARDPIDIDRPSRVVEVGVPPVAERWAIVAPIVDASVDDLAPAALPHFELSTARLVVAARHAAREDVSVLDDRLWTACQQQARPQLERLAQRIEPASTWDDLVVSAEVEAMLRSIKAHVRHQAVVYDEWGFRDRSSRGLGVTALFAGESGTGKTMAAEVLANDLALDLFRIDLSSVVSKYIGETEKNLRRVFDAAEAGGAILLFDEADALFGKRTEIKDSHDRYANIEVSYLLQRMEAYRGLAILTTNQRDALDQAFLRRIRFVVPFRFPVVEERERLWDSIWPTATPVGKLDRKALGALTVAGGNIRSIALDAAFRTAAAAADDTDTALIDMPAVAAAVRAEAYKIELPLRASEWGNGP